MTPELTALALAGLLHIAGFAAYSVRANLDVGLGYSTSPRDRAPRRELSVTASRLGRAYDNSVAMFALFAGGALLVALTAQSTTYTGVLAFAYLGLRALYIPAYAFGWTPWRSYVWLAALLCCALLYLAALVPRGVT